jgi:hypothetical protein
VAPEWKPLLTTWRQFQNTHDFDNKKKHIYGAGEGDLSTGAVMGGQVGPTASTFHDHCRSVLDRQVPGRVSASGEVGRNTKETKEEDGEPPKMVTRTSQRIADGSVGGFLAPAMVLDAMSSMAGG